MNSIRTFLCLVVAMMVTAAARADLVFSQPPSASGGIHKSSWYAPDGLDGDEYAYDSFTLATDATISQIRWRGGYTNYLQGAGTSPVYNFRIEIYRSGIGDPTRPSPEFMKFHPRVAPIKAAVFPLMDKDGLPEVAAKLYTELKAKFGKLGMVEYDEKQNIGKRYARMDEAGCPYCFTIDADTLKDNTVTVRDRDTGHQHRIAIDTVSSFLAAKLGL